MKLKIVKCPKCGADFGVERGNKVGKCEYCGYEVYFDDGYQTTTTNKNVNIYKETYHTERYIDDADIIRAEAEKIKARKGRHEGLWSIIGFLLCFVGIFVVFFSPFLIGEHKKEIAISEGKISAGYYKDLVGKDFKTVEAHFESAGFREIQLIDLDDAGVFIWNEGKVDSISVGGDTNFDSGDFFDPHTKVVISYH